MRGWAKQPLSDERMLIRVLVNNVEVAEVLADQFREDLLRNKIGDGRHGFLVPLPMLTHTPAAIEVIATTDNSTIGTAEISRAGGRATG